MSYFTKIIQRAENMAPRNSLRPDLPRIRFRQDMEGDIFKNNSSSHSKEEDSDYNASNVLEPNNITQSKTPSEHITQSSSKTSDSKTNANPEINPKRPFVTNIKKEYPSNLRKEIPNNKGTREKPQEINPKIKFENSKPGNSEKGDTIQVSKLKKNSPEKSKPGNSDKDELGLNLKELKSLNELQRKLSEQINKKGKKEVVPLKKKSSIKPQMTSYDFLKLSKKTPSVQPSRFEVIQRIPKHAAPEKKLIIGKITVEIESPSKPQEVIHVKKVYQKVSGTNSFQKINKISNLRFGLSQL